MIFYKIRHKPTGLYFKPTRWPYKENLSEKGKVYSRKPSLKYLASGYYPKGTPAYTRGGKSFILPFIESEWEIAEFVVG